MAAAPGLGFKYDPAVIKERLLREELRSSQHINLRIMQWALTTMASVETALYFVRRDLTRQYVEQQLIKAGELLPVSRYKRGTIFLVMLAVLFCILSSWVYVRLYSYRKQLYDMTRPSGIAEMTPRPLLLIAVWFMYFSFPFFDLAMRMTLQVR